MVGQGGDSLEDRVASARLNMAPNERFDVVIIGSGFGGSVMAYRTAAAKLSVCVLERGKPYPPGSFPRSPRDMAANFWDPERRRPRPLPGMGVARNRGGCVGRSRRWILDLRKRAHPQR